MKGRVTTVIAIRDLIVFTKQKIGLNFFLKHYTLPHFIVNNTAILSRASRVKASKIIFPNYTSTLIHKIRIVMYDPQSLNVLLRMILLINF
jgi:hypothetical protein